MSIEEKFESTIDKCVRKKNIFGHLIICLRKIGITQNVRKIWIRLIYFKTSINPTEEMIESKIFFENHKEDIEFNLSLLSDADSKEVYQRIISFRCTHKLSDFPKYNLKNQYFDMEIVPQKDNYIFVDGGSYTGDTVENFLNFTKNKYEKIICFEPDVENIEALNKNIKNNKMQIIPKGMWFEKTVLHFSTSQTASKISEDGDSTIEVTNIDSEISCANANFIKMDIEGAELNALKGAASTIKNNKPVLAICIYHSNEDMINIIQWINNLNLGYTFYVRHHSFDIHETVLYAIP